MVGLPLLYSSLLSGSTANSHRLLQNVCQVAVGSTTALEGAPEEERKEENRQKEVGASSNDTAAPRLPALESDINKWTGTSWSLSRYLFNGGHTVASITHKLPLLEKKKKFKVYIDICIFLNRVPLDGIV